MQRAHHDQITHRFRSKHLQSMLAERRRSYLQHAQSQLQQEFSKCLPIITHDNYHDYKQRIHQWMHYEKFALELIKLVGIVYEELVNSKGGDPQSLDILQMMCEYQEVEICCTQQLLQWLIGLCERERGLIQKSLNIASLLINNPRHSKTIGSHILKSEYIEEVHKGQKLNGVSSLLFYQIILKCFPYTFIMDQGLERLKRLIDLVKQYLNGEYQQVQEELAWAICHTFTDISQSVQFNTKEMPLNFQIAQTVVENFKEIIIENAHSKGIVNLINFCTLSKYYHNLLLKTLKRSFVIFMQSKHDYVDVIGKCLNCLIAYRELDEEQFEFEMSHQELKQLWEVASNRKGSNRKNRLLAMQMIDTELNGFEIEELLELIKLSVILSDLIESIKDPNTSNEEVMLGLSLILKFVEGQNWGGLEELKPWLQEKAVTIEDEERRKAVEEILEFME